MPTPAPAPRLPLEPADRPLYRPPSRLGCSGISLVSLAALVAFVFFLRIVAPNVTDRLAAIQVPAPIQTVLEQANATATETAVPDTLPGAGTPLPVPNIVATPTGPAPTPVAVVPATATPPAGPTVPPAPEYVQVANTGGAGVYLRSDARQDAEHLAALPEKSVLLVVGPNKTVGGSIWRNLRTLTDTPQTGWILAQYLAPAAPPPPPPSPTTPPP